MWSIEQIAELDERIRKTKYELDQLEEQRTRMMKERWKWKKKFRSAREHLQKIKLERIANNG
jgi:predicted nuclease with TOPRIM domain